MTLSMLVRRAACAAIATLTTVTFVPSARAGVLLLTELEGQG